jgi:hypothetical protein
MEVSNGMILLCGLMKPVTYNYLLQYERERESNMMYTPTVVRSGDSFLF